MLLLKESSKKMKKILLLTVSLNIITLTATAEEATLKTLEAASSTKATPIKLSETKASEKKRKIKNQFDGSITIADSISCQDDSPCAVVANTTKEVFANLRKASPYKLIQETIAPKFDFRLMTKYALGKNWNLASADQQNQLVELFKELLVYTYSSALSKFQGAEITITNSSINSSSNNKLSNVVSQVYLPNNDKNNNQSVKVEYDLAYLNNKWKAYDIKIENASLVTTYRNQFNDIIQSNGVNGLITQLKTKNAGLKKKSINQ